MPLSQRITTGDEGIRVLIPVLSRPGRAKQVHDSLVASQQETPLRALFLVSLDDSDELDAVESTGADFIEMPFQRARGDYARKINWGFRVTEEPWLFNAADDVRFTPGWAEAALACAERTGVRVIGTNDLGRWAGTRRPSPHSLVARSYGEERGTIDQKGNLLHEGYDHQYVDTELVETARARGEYAYAEDAIVEHMHPVWRKATLDRIYRLGQASGAVDYQLFRRRERLWKT